MTTARHSPHKSADTICTVVSLLRGMMAELQHTIDVIDRQAAPCDQNQFGKDNYHQMIFRDESAGSSHPWVKDRQRVQD